MKKKIMAVLCTLVLCMTLTSSVFAAETGNSVFKFKTAGKYTAIADKRPKTNSTPIYVRVDSSQYSAYIQAYGFIPTGNTCVWKNMTYGTTKVIARPGISSSIRTTIYEKQGRTANLHGRAVAKTVTTGGVWSPDSTRTYTLLN